MKIRTGDTVVVITGKDKGKTGQVLRVLQNKNRLVVGDINMRTRHMKKTPQRAGQIIKYEASIAISNVMFVDPKSKKRSRIGFSVDDKGRKSRIAKRSGESVSQIAIKTKEVKTEAKEEKKETTKTEKKAVETKTENAPKKPFWKKMGFGAEAIEEAGQDSASQSADDHSVPDQAQRMSNRSSQRGS